MNESLNKSSVDTTTRTARVESIGSGEQVASESTDNESSVQPIVYVVDDDQAVRDSVIVVCEPLGVPIECFESAETFLEEWDRNTPGCLLLDVRMPGMSGIELHRTLSLEASFLSVVLVTGHATVSMTVESLKRGAFHFLEKPYAPRELRHIVTEGLEWSKAARRYHSLRNRFEQKKTTLSPRECEVYACLVLGRETKQIANRLGISNSTVEKHRISVLRKMSADNVAQLVAQEFALGKTHART